MLADIAGDKHRTVPPETKGNRSDMAVWADMLCMIGEKNNRLYSLLARNARPRTAPLVGFGRTIVHELERERSRIARELHAGAGQPLAGIKLTLETLVDCAAVLPEAGREALDRLQTLASQALEQVRSVSHSLHPPDWQGLSTEDALRYLIRSSGLAGRLEVETHIDLPVEPSHTTKIAIYRCAQECISNVVRHSGATRFAMFVVLVGSTVELRLEDNGCGFPQESAAGKGIGLVAIREHAEALEGTCHISSNTDGVRICVQLPLSAD
jgi:two-component system, NarL family, sensor histidine kinase UhpB